MSVENYIVEGTNWKCKVALEKVAGETLEYRLVEAATRCIEHLFGTFVPNSDIDVFELTDFNGADFFKMESIDDDSVPDPAFGLLIKVYKLKDAKNEQNHYVILTKKLMENAGTYEALTLAHQLEEVIKKQNPKLFNTIEKVMRNTLTLKYSDLKKFEEGDS